MRLSRSKYYKLSFNTGFIMSFGYEYNPTGLHSIFYNYCLEDGRLIGYSETPTHKEFWI